MDSKYSTKDVQKAWSLSVDTLRANISELGFNGDLNRLKVKEDLVNLYVELKFTKPLL